MNRDRKSFCEEEISTKLVKESKETFGTGRTPRTLHYVAMGVRETG